MKDKRSKKYHIEVVYDGLKETGLHVPIRKFMSDKEFKDISKKGKNETT